MACLIFKCHGRLYGPCVMVGLLFMCCGLRNVYVPGLTRVPGPLHFPDL